ncbi:MAG: hypothetical protein NE327_07445 [Lentisphaeraceae bacterium]|nr:hypothetical protein [Lentisphaeraceae bacterium]
MNWESAYKEIRQAQESKDNALAFQLFDKAKKEFHSSSDKDINWLIEALKNKEQKFFVAHLFQRTSMPKKLFKYMVEAALLEENASLNNEFIKACLNSYDSEKTLEEVQKQKEKAKDISKVLYWLER